MSDETPTTPLSPDTKFRLVSLDLIDDPAHPLRTDLSPESVEDLVVSIKHVGIIEPLVVRARGGRFEVIAGHRRLVAATIAELAEAPCYILKADDDQVEVLKIHENLYRQEISPVDQAEHFDYLIQQRKLTPDKIAQLIGKSPSYVFDRLAILNYEPELREVLNARKIKFSVARAFYQLHDRKKLVEYLSYAVRSGLTPALAKQWVDEYNRQAAPQPPPPPNGSTLPNQETQHETLTTCIKCTEKVGLAEAVICYMHPKCFEEVTA